MLDFDPTKGCFITHKKSLKDLFVNPRSGNYLGIDSDNNKCYHVNSKLDLEPESVKLAYSHS